MSLRQSNQSTNDWNWLRDTDSTSSDDLYVNGASVDPFDRFSTIDFFPLLLQIGVLAIHLHHLRIDKPFIQWMNSDQQEVLIDTFRLCISVYALSRYSKTVRVYSTENTARFDQTMQMLIRVETIISILERSFFIMLRSTILDMIKDI